MLIATAILLATLVVLIIVKLRQIYKTFERLGIKGPPPTFLIGNLLDIHRDKTGKSIEEVLMDWVSKYGPVFGYFEGVNPVLYVANPDTLQQILQSDFQHFVNRPMRDDFFSGSRGDVFTSRGQRWKRVRSVLSPVFSPANMRDIAPAVDEKINHFISKLKDISLTGKGFDIYDQFQKLTLDVIGQMAFGMNVNSIQDDSHPFVHHCRETFRVVSGANRSIWIETCKSVLPIDSLRLVALKIIGIAETLIKGKTTPLAHFYYLSGAVKKVVDERKENPVFATEPDLLALMLKYANEGQGLPETNGHIKGNYKKVMSLQEVQMNCWVFLIAGYETSSTALAYLSHALCQHPEVQERLTEEIRTYQKAEKEKSGSEELSHATVQKMEYLDQVVRETLRVYPPATSVIRREIAEDVKLSIPDGSVVLPAGMSIQVGILSAHYNPKFWPSPSTFDPSRFSAENRKNHHLYQFLPFGMGPRGCIGMRLALMEIKLSLVKLIANFRIEPCEGTVTNLEFDEGITRTPRGGVTVKLTARTAKA